ncbi:MAG: hypothetical protein AUJ12_04195 [Alphaproteobacteria bacterium CG1_02_46_17]|nr:MAG: hypothetical protein AUJ12_04195 [Alphaproteobacteria bacterium CG1_02_46_17]
MKQDRVDENTQFIDQFIGEVVKRDVIPDGEVDYRNQADREYDKRLAQMLKSMRHLWKEQARPFISPVTLTKAVESFGRDFGELNDLVALNVGSIRGTALSHLLSSYYRSEYLAEEQKKINFLGEAMLQYADARQSDLNMGRDKVQASGTYGLPFMPVVAPIDLTVAWVSAAQTFWGVPAEEPSSEKSLKSEFSKAPVSLSVIQGGLGAEWQRSPARGHLKLVVG